MSKLNTKMVVSEYFYSLQGEGRTMGIPAIFLRLAGCNLMCGGKGTEKDKKLHDGATWRCDTIEVWMEGRSRLIEELIEELNEKLDFIKRLKAGVHLVITGGEPLMQEASILYFLNVLKEKYETEPIIEIETNATVQPSESLDQKVSYWNTSPKLSNSGMAAHHRLFPLVLKWFNENKKTMFKFVLSKEEDWAEVVRDFITAQGMDTRKIVLMPAADSIEQLLVLNKMVADICIQHQIRMCTRLHIEIWNQLTGV